MGLIMLITLLTLADNGDDRLFFAQIYEKNEKLMLVIANRILHSKEKAEEAVQDAFVKAIEHLSELKRKNEEELKAWLIVVVRHISLNTAKRESQVEYFNPQDWYAAETDRTIEGFKNEINYRRLKESIRELPSVYKDVLYLRIVCEWSYEEIERELNIEEKILGTRIKRGKEMLIRKLMREENINQLQNTKISK